MVVYKIIGLGMLFILFNTMVVNKAANFSLHLIDNYVTGKTATINDIYYPSPDSLDGWRQLTTAMDIRSKTGIDIKKLDEAFAFIQGSTKNGGLLVLRKGWLVYENYFGLGHREANPNLASCGKSFTSISTGILMAEKPALFPDGLRQKVFTPTYFPADAFPLTDSDKAGITLGQLLTFTAGIRGNNPVYVYGKPQTIAPAGPDGIQASIDEVAFGKKNMEENGVTYSASQLWCAPGGGYSYATSSIHLVSVLLRHIAGMELEQFIKIHLAKPMGWGRWGYGYKDGENVKHTPGGGGIALRATDMLRFGYMLLQQGRWAGKQLVPADYVKLCSRQSPFNPHYPYSLQFDVNSDNHFPRLPEDAFWKTGSGGHVLYVVPSLDLVVWKLGGRDGQYSETQTGFPVLPDVVAKTHIRTGWIQTVKDADATPKTLELVISAIEKK